MIEMVGREEWEKGRDGGEGGEEGGMWEDLEYRGWKGRVSGYWGEKYKMM